MSVASLSLAEGFFTTSATCLSKVWTKVWGFINWTTWIISSTSSLTPSTHACCLSFPTPFKQVQLSLCIFWHIPLATCLNLNISFLTGESEWQKCVRATFVVQSPSPVWLFATPWISAQQASLSLTISWSLPKFMFIGSLMPSSHLTPWCPLLLLPSSFPDIKDFYSESTVPINDQNNGASGSAPVHLSEYSWLISLNIDWSSCCPRGFQENSPAPQFKGPDSLGLWLLYGAALTTICDHWEDHSLDSMNLCRRVMSLLFNTLSSFVIAFLPRSNRLVISWLQSPSTVFWSPRRGNLSLLPPFPLLFTMK